MDAKEIKNILIHELPLMIQRDEEIRTILHRILQGYFPNKKETDDRFWETLREIRTLREEEAKKWEEHLLADNKRWEEQQRKWDEQQQKWHENQKKLDEQGKRTDETLAAIKEEQRARNRTIGALGARWGLNSEIVFRSGLKAILEENFGVKVQNYLEFDKSGEVFGSPDQVELDLIVKNGLLIVCEIKSSISRSEMHTFHRKVQFYEKREGSKVSRKMVISPMVDSRAMEVATQLNIEVFCQPEDVQP